MVAERIIVNLEERPDLVRLVEESTTSHAAIVVRKDGEDIAIIVPIPNDRAERPVRTAEDYEAFLSAAGGWAGHLDVDEFIERNYKQRLVSTRPPIDL